MEVGSALDPDFSSTKRGNGARESKAARYASGLEDANAPFGFNGSEAEMKNEKMRM
jgi:hypothetical protein